MELTFAMREMLEQKVRAQLEPDGWQVTAKAFGRGFSIELEHELSNMMGICMVDGDRDPVAHLERMLQSWEVHIR